MGFVLSVYGFWPLRVYERERQRPGLTLTVFVDDGIAFPEAGGYTDTIDDASPTNCYLYHHEYVTRARQEISGGWDHVTAVLWFPDPTFSVDSHQCTTVSMPVKVKPC